MPNAAQSASAALSVQLLAVEEASRVFRFRRRRTRVDRSLSTCVISVMQRRLSEPLTIRALAREAGYTEVLRFERREKRAVEIAAC